jgi:hypothetical protein
LIDLFPDRRKIAHFKEEEVGDDLMDAWVIFSFDLDATAKEVEPPILLRRAAIVIEKEEGFIEGEHVVADRRHIADVGIDTTQEGVNGGPFLEKEEVRMRFIPLDPLCYQIPFLDEKIGVEFDNEVMVFGEVFYKGF